MPLSKIDDPQRLRRLLDAVLVIERDLSLRVVLETLVRESCLLASAQYAALGVLDDSGAASANSSPTAWIRPLRI